MDKSAQTDIKIHELIKKRWSPRAFSPQSIKQKSLVKIFEAARWSASGFNEQPWRFLVGVKGNDKSWQKIFDILNESNQIWCKNAPVLILLVAKNIFSHNEKPNRWNQYDLGQAAAYMSVQAMTENIFVHQMAGFYPDKAKETFSIPEDYDPITAMALGYLGNPDILPDDLKAREIGERKRKNISELVYSENWEQKSNLYK